MSLDPAIQRVREDLTRQISEKLETATAGWKESKLVDIETTEAILNRLQTWAKLFGFFVAIPLILITVWLGLLGYKSYTDVKASIAKAQADIDQKISPQIQETAGIVASLQGGASQLSVFQSHIAKEQAALDPKVKAAEQNIDSLVTRQVQISAQQDSIAREEKSIDPILKKAEQDVADLQARERELGKQVDVARQLAPQVESLSKRVDNIQTQIANFLPAPELTADRQERIGQILSSFRYYLIKLEFTPPATNPTIGVDNNHPERTSVDEKGTEMKIGSEVLDAPASYLWEYADIVLSKAMNPAGDSYWKDILSHYYVSSFLGKIRDTEVHYPGGDNVRYNWVMVCWKIRENIGGEAADALFATVLRQASPRGKQDVDSYLSGVIIKTADSLEGGRYSTKVRMLLAGDLPQFY
jgi:hypothetical protein